MGNEHVQKKSHNREKLDHLCGALCNYGSRIVDYGRQVENMEHVKNKTWSERESRYTYRSQLHVFTSGYHIAGLSFSLERMCPRIFGRFGQSGVSHKKVSTPHMKNGLRAPRHARIIFTFHKPQVHSRHFAG